MVHQKTLKIFLIVLICGSSVFSEEISPPKEIFSKLNALLKNQQSDYFEKTVRRMGNRKISLESFASIEADWNLFQKIAKNIADYPTWALPNINNKGGGEKFYIQIAGMKADPSHPSNIDLDVVLALPALHIPIKRVFKFDFPPSGDKSVFLMKFSAVQSEDSPVKDMSGVLMFFRSPLNPGRIWAYADVSVVLTHWIIYESLPERLLNSESGERIRILMENYQSFENKQH